MLFGVKLGTLICNKNSGGVLIFPQKNIKWTFSSPTLEKKKE